MKIKKGLLALAITTQLVMAFDLGDIDISSIENIDQSIGDATKSINDLLGYDVNSIIKDVGLENDTLSCLTKGSTLSSLLGSSVTADGICKTLGVSTDLGLGSLLDSSTAKCFGVDTPKSVDESIKAFEELCKRSTEDIKTSLVGGVFDGAVGDSTTTSTGWTTYDSTSTIAIGTVATSSVTGGVKTSGTETTLEEKKAPNKKTMKEIYGDDGGVILKHAKEDTTSSDASAVRHNKKATLILKEKAAQLNADGSTDESKMGLPVTKLDVMKKQIASAELIGMSQVDYVGLTNKIVKRLREEFIKLDANSLNEYYTKELELYKKMMLEDSEIVKFTTDVTEKAIAGISSKYAIKLEALKGDKDYIFNTSQSYATLVRKKHRDEYILKAMLQNNAETIIMGEMAEEKRRIGIKIEAIKQNAYSYASIFREDIAKKEIDALLKAVDTTIK